MLESPIMPLCLKTKFDIYSAKGYPLSDFYLHSYFLVTEVLYLVRFILVIKFLFVYEPVHLVDGEIGLAAALYVGYPFHYYFG